MPKLVLVFIPLVKLRNGFISHTALLLVIPDNKVLSFGSMKAQLRKATPGAYVKEIACFMPGAGDSGRARWPG